MGRLYYERNPFVLDWSNIQGRTALHMAAMKGNEAFVAVGLQLSRVCLLLIRSQMLCDLHADIDLADLVGNTPLH